MGRIFASIRSGDSFARLSPAVLILLTLTASGTAWGWTPDSATSTATTAATAATVVSAGTITATQATDCTTCHGANVVANHHQSSYFLQGQCNHCHQGITTGSGCDSCHNFTLQNNKHHAAATGSSIDCNQCHSGGVNTTDCLACHAGKVRTRHHQVAQAGISCSTCHPGSPAASNCRDCHAREITRTDHHTLGNACTACHTQINTPQNCRNCHAPGSKLQEHHAQPVTGGLNCSSCHTNLPVGSLGSGCAQCHAGGNNRELHHRTVMQAKGLSCNACHSSAPNSSNGCAGCHQGKTGTIHHASASYLSGNCSACHTVSAGFEKPGCKSCHNYPKSAAQTGNIRHHNTLAMYYDFGLICTDCHARSQGDEIPPANCIFCHESPAITPAGDLPGTHHASTAATSGNCGLCHSGGGSGGLDCAGCHLSGGAATTASVHHDPAPGSAYSTGACSSCHSGITGGLSCADCHTAPPGSSVLSRHHDLYAPAKNLLCTGCHTGSEQISQSCGTAGCHEPTGGSLTVRHHEQSMPGMLKQCDTCHTGITAASLACGNCHGAAAATPIAARHHASPTGQSGVCSSCHNEASPASSTCSSCHAGGKHHLQPQAVAGNCGACHGNVQLVGGSCRNCHTAPIPEIHHGDPLTAVAGNCGACHQSASDPALCANCHASSPHHATTWSQTGDCGHCHAVPASAVDRPAQAACRECHGATMHDKGGAIQNFGVCAACHNTTPFHADQGIPRASEDRAPTNTGAGRGKFNMFMARNSAQGEEGKWKPKTRLTFSTRAISHDGRNYTVPYFTGAAGASSNLALGKTATATRAESGYAASLAVDGDTSTRWWAKSTGSQSLTVDLGTSRSINKVSVRWHNDYATSYQVRTSTDNRNWSSVASTTSGKGGLAEWTFSSRNARYVQIYSTRAASSNGYSIYELEVSAP